MVSYTVIANESISSIWISLTTFDARGMSLCSIFSSLLRASLSRK